MDHAQSAVRTHDPVFHIVAWTAGPYRSRGGSGRPGTVLGVDQVEPTSDRPRPQYAHDLVRNSHPIGREVALPPTDMGEALRLFRSGMTLRQLLLRALAPGRQRGDDQSGRKEQHDPLDVLGKVNAQ